jgi:hypothetical protein
MPGGWIRGLVLSMLALTIGACGGSPPAPSQNPSLNLTGTWSGVVGAGSGGGRALRVTWTASQTSSNLSGPATLLTSPAVTDITLSGTLTGTLTGSQLSLTYVTLPGACPDRQTVRRRAPDQPTPPPARFQAPSMSLSPPVMVSASSHRQIIS